MEAASIGRAARRPPRCAPAAEDVLAALREIADAANGAEIVDPGAAFVGAASTLFGPEGCGVGVVAPAGTIVARSATGSAARVYDADVACGVDESWEHGVAVERPAVEWPQLVDGAAGGRSIIGIRVAHGEQWYAFCWLVVAAGPRRVAASAARAAAFTSFARAALPSVVAGATALEADELRADERGAERTYLLRELLAGSSDTDGVEAAVEATGWPLARVRYLSIVAVRPRDGAERRDHVRVARSLHEALRRQLRDTVAISCGSDVIVLVDAPDNADEPPARTAALSRVENAVAACRRAQRDLDTVTVLGDVCRSAADYAPAYAAAGDAASIARKLGRQTLDARELGIFRLLLKAAPRDELVAYADGVLEPLRAYDRDGSKALEMTLRLYLQQGANQRQTAAAGYLHPNTVAYRLRRVAEVLGRNLGAPETLLELQLAFKIDELRAAVA